MCIRDRCNNKPKLKAYLKNYLTFPLDKSKKLIIKPKIGRGSKYQIVIDKIKDFQISKEEILRGKDKKFSNCLYLEFTNGNDAVFLMDNAKSIFNEAEIGAYQLISTLT